MKTKHIISPTGLGIRSDSGGDGHYGASRRKGDKKYKHKGTDFICQDGQVVQAPIAGEVVRIARPYIDHPEYSGLVIDGGWIRVKMFYLEPYDHLIATEVWQGKSIGIAQNIGELYKGVTPHIHLEIVNISKNPEDYWA